LRKRAKIMRDKVLQLSLDIRINGLRMNNTCRLKGWDWKKLEPFVRILNMSIKDYQLRIKDGG
jgi:hypothetical protein